MKKKESGGRFGKGKVESVSEQENKGITSFPEEYREELSLYCSASGRVVFTSSGLRELLDEELDGRNLNDFVADRTVAQVIAKTQVGETMDFECTLGGLRFSCEASQEREPDEELIYIRLLPLTQKGGAFITVNAARFITRELQIDASMMLADVQMMEREQGIPEERLQLLADIKRSVFRLIRTARSLEDCALAENGLQEMVFRQEDLTALFKEMEERLEPLFQNSGIALKWNLPEKPMSWIVDGEKVRRMLLHLIANSAASISESGTIEISLKERDKTAMFSVSDNGRGIKKSDMGDVFRKHTQMDPMYAVTAGTGLGLTIVRSFAEGHGGRLMVVSNEKRGTSAQVLLPQQTPERMVLREFYSSYGTGIDVALVELSTVLDTNCYLKQKR